METTTPFDLNRAIQQWRESLEQSPAFRRENLDELETHLRDSVAVLQPRGLSEEEAFLVAARRAGSRAILGAEFGKINTRSIWLDRVLWMLVGNLFFWFVSGLLSTMGSGLLFLGFLRFGGFALGAPSSSSRYLWFAFLNVAINLLTFAAVLTLCWRLFTHHWGRVSHWLARNSRSSSRLVTMGVLGVILWELLRLAPSFYINWMARFTEPSVMGRLAMGATLGSAISSFAESLIIVFLALWLARRRLLAKNPA